MVRSSPIQVLRVLFALSLTFAARAAAADIDFRITSFFRDVPTGRVFLGWTSADGISYRVEKSSDGISWTEVVTDFPSGGAAAGTTSFLTAPQSESRAFYRVVRLMPSSLMTLIPSNTFQRGDASSPRVGKDSEQPVRPITLSAYHIGRTEVTLAEWNSVLSYASQHSYEISGGAAATTDRPVTQVNWYDVVKWCNARSEKEGLAPCYLSGQFIYRSGTTDPTCDFGKTGYRLPTEAEWECAARAGTDGANFPWGASISHALANYYVFSTDGATNFYSYDVSPTLGYHPDYHVGFTFTAPVARFASNAWGLFDMTGNVKEWCWDRYAFDYYEFAAATNPHGPAISASRSVRGGSWGSSASDCRVAARGNAGPAERTYAIGFRIARTAP